MIESIDPNGPYGAKEVGMPVTMSGTQAYFRLSLMPSVSISMIIILHRTISTGYRGKEEDGRREVTL
jgi:hypothetical protein